MSAGLVIISAPEEFEAIREHLGSSSARADGAAIPEIQWMSVESVLPPAADASQDEREDWESRLHVLSGKGFAAFTRVGFKSAGGEMRTLADWHAQIDGLFKKHVQQHVQNGVKPTAIIVFERELTLEEVQWMEQNLCGYRVFIMLHQLRVSSLDRRLVHSRHAWPHATARLLQLLGSGAETADGFHAWRCLDISIAVDQTELCEKLKRQCLHLASEASGQESAIGVKVDGPSPLEEKVDFSSLGNDEGAAEVEFAHLEPGGARKWVDKEMDEGKIADQLESLGREWRRSVVGSDLTEAAMVTRDQSAGWWKQVRQGRTDPGLGLGILAKLTFRLGAKRQELGIADRLKKQWEEWRKVAAAGSDYVRRRTRLIACARQVDIARDYFVSIKTRVLMGVVCALLISFTLAQVVEAWAAIWIGPFGSVLVRHSGILAIFLLACLLGCALGILLPSFLERWRGDRALRVVLDQVEANARQRRAELARRESLCRNARTLGLFFLFGDWLRASGKTIGRAKDTVLLPFEEVFLGISTPEAQIPMSVPNAKEHEESRYYSKASVLPLKSCKEEDAPDALLDDETLGKLTDGFWNRWEKGIGSIDTLGRGWLERDACRCLIERLILAFRAEVTSKVVEKRSASADTLDWQDKETIGSASDWIQPQSQTGALPLMSCSFQVTQEIHGHLLTHLLGIREIADKALKELHFPGIVEKAKEGEDEPGKKSSPLGGRDGSVAAAVIQVLPFHWADGQVVPVMGRVSK
jgi:hypothetical protein